MTEPRIRILPVSDGQKLKFRHWKTDAAVKGHVVALHGIQSHSGWYKASSRTLCEAGFNVYFADRRGSGLNGINRGHADHGQRLLSDVRELIRLVGKENDVANLPVCLMGISWGGMIATAFAIQHPGLVDRLVLLTPGLRPRIRAGKWQRFLLKIARRHDIRRKELPIPLRDVALFTDSREYQELIEDDPLVLRYATSGLFNSGIDLDKVINAGRNSLTHPVMLALAGRDQIIDNEATRNLAADFISSALVVREYPKARHTLEFEPNRDEIVADVIRFLTW